MTEPSLAEIHLLIRQGDRRAAQRELARLLKSEPANREAWLLLAQLVDDPARKADCYRHVLEIDPGNQVAAKALEWIYSQPLLGMDLPEPLASELKPEFIESVNKQESLPERTLFDLDPNGEDYFSPEQKIPDEELIPISEPILLHKKPKFKSVFISILGLILLAAVSFGLWKLLLHKSPGLPTAQETHKVQSTSPAGEVGSTITLVTPVLPEETTVPALVTSNIPVRIVWSNSGKLTFLNQGQSVTLTKTDSSTIKTLLSFDGEYAAFSRSSGIWVINVHESNNERLLVRPVALPKDDLPRGTVSRAPDEFKWLPGSHKILFNTVFSPYSGSIQSANDLFLVDYELGKVTRLLPFGSGGAIYPSPDGASVAEISPSTIRVYDLSTSKIATFFDYGPVISANGGTASPEVIWDKSSHEIVTAIPPLDAVSQPNAPTRLWRIPVDGSDPVMVVELHTLGGPVFISPDLSQISYILDASARRDGNGEWHICSLDGSHDMILLAGKTGVFLGWSADGSAAAFGIGADPPEIWLYDSASGSVRQYSSGFSSGTALTRFEWVSDAGFLVETKAEKTTRLWYSSLSSQPVLLVEDAAGADIHFDGVLTQ